MLRQIKVVLATLFALVVLDVMVALVLTRAPAGLSAFFDYGRSVPGKIAQWQERQDRPGNLLNVAWQPEMLAESATHFAGEDPASGPIVRHYGMSFTQQLLQATQRARPDLMVDGHAGPGASPNFVYSVFLDDRTNRRTGDVVVFGILSSSVPALGSFSNRVWVFEQPAPFTYPIFRPDGLKGLKRTDPAITAHADMTDPVKIAAFDAQMRAEDALWTPQAFALPALDASPFVRLLRRATATGAIESREANVTTHPEDGTMPWAEVLRLMVRDVARISREDNQVPLIVLIQARDTASPQLRPVLVPMLEAEGIPYLATDEVANPRDTTAFLSDGHLTTAVNDVLAQRLLGILKLP
ncbi:MAG TPA: hypothetical protein VGC40_12895 [Paenirhodobacter sp.]